MSDFIEPSEVKQLSTTHDVQQENMEGSGFGYSLLMLGDRSAHTFVADYWSPQRDLELSIFFRKVDYLKIAVNTFVSKVLNVPLRFTPENPSSQFQVNLADSLATTLQTNSELLKGFSVALKKFVLDYLTQDNGAFLYIYGDGAKTGPIIGMPYGVEHLPSQRCTRTGNPEFPVRYLHTNGSRYLIHFSRIIEMVNLPSSEPMLRGVGMCPVSLCLDSAQELRDITVYTQEKLGSRPQRQILYAKTGATIGQLQEAVTDMDMKLESKGFTRFARTGLLAPKLPGGKLELDTLDLVSTPDGFERQTVVMLDTAVICASFGLDLRDLAFSFGIQGQTKSDAIATHDKGLGKGVAEFLFNLAIEITKKFCPEHITAVFDFVDDSQDEKQADIRGKRTQSRTRDIMAGVTTIQATRKQMFLDHEIDQTQLEQMELEDGRLPDGTDLNRLLHSDDPFYSQYLTFTSSEFPEDSEFYEGDVVEMVGEINEKLLVVYKEFEKSDRSELKSRKLRQVITLLTRLKTAYTEKQTMLTQQQQMLDNMQMGLDTTKTVSNSKPNNLLSPQERMNNVAGKGTQKGLPQPNKQKTGGQNGNKPPLSSRKQA